MLHYNYTKSPLNPCLNGPNRWRTSRNETLNSILSKGFPYSSKLSAHTSCVNALAFSSGDGRFLASAGDGCVETCIWDFHKDDVTAPSCFLRGPRGNVFTLAFSATNRYLYSFVKPYSVGIISDETPSGGTDETVLKYDVSTVGSPIDERTIKDPDLRFTDYDDTIREISAHPYQEEVFLTASQDGRILLHDGRVRGRLTKAQHTLQFAYEATGVQYHPNMEHIFVTSDSHGQVCLRDTRMAFGPSSARDRQGIVQNYTTMLSRKNHSYISNPEASSVTFDREGNKLAVTMLHYLPTIYGLLDPNPLAVCSGKKWPDGTSIDLPQRSYSNSCTIKHGGFGSAGLDSDQFFASGSEDFRSYVWKIPSLSQLKDSRLELSLDEWISTPQEGIAFTEGANQPRFIPVDLDTPYCLLTGHKSIVNMALFHPHLPHILTCGIEKDIIIHSPTATSPVVYDLQRTSTEVRALSDCRSSGEAYINSLAEMTADMPEYRTIQMFDHIIRSEGDTDVFEARRFVDPDDSSDEELHTSDNESGSNDLIDL